MFSSHISWQSHWCGCDNNFARVGEIVGGWILSPSQNRPFNREIALNMHDDESKHNSMANARIFSAPLVSVKERMA